MYSIQRPSLGRWRHNVSLHCFSPPFPPPLYIHELFFRLSALLSFIRVCAILCGSGAKLVEENVVDESVLDLLVYIMRVPLYST